MTAMVSEELTTVGAMQPGLFPAPEGYVEPTSRQDLAAHDQTLAGQLGAILDHVNSAPPGTLAAELRPALEALSVHAAPPTTLPKDGPRGPESKLDAHAPIGDYVETLQPETDRSVDTSIRDLLVGLSPAAHPEYKASMWDFPKWGQGTRDLLGFVYDHLIVKGEKVTDEFALSIDTRHGLLYAQRLLLDAKMSVWERAEGGRHRRTASVQGNSEPLPEGLALLYHSNTSVSGDAIPEFTSIKELREYLLKTIETADLPPFARTELDTELTHLFWDVREFGSLNLDDPAVNFDDSVELVAYLLSLAEDYQSMLDARFKEASAHNTELRRAEQALLDEQAKQKALREAILAQEARRQARNARLAAGARRLGSAVIHPGRTFGQMVDWTLNTAESSRPQNYRPEQIGATHVSPLEYAVATRQRIF